MIYLPPPPPQEGVGGFVENGGYPSSLVLNNEVMILSLFAFGTVGQRSHLPGRRSRIPSDAFAVDPPRAAPVNHLSQGA